MTNEQGIKLSEMKGASGYKGVRKERIVVVTIEDNDYLVLENGMTIDIEEIKKLRSMCKAAADEIEQHWDAHCGDDGYGPINLVDRLKGKRPPDLYPGFDA